MRPTPKQFKAQLKEGLKPLYVISGDSALLIDEYADAIFTAAKQQQIEERIRHDITAHFNWAELQFSLQNQSLFTNKQIIDIRNSDNRCDAKANKALVEICEHISPDQTILLRFGKLTSAQLKSAWYKKLSAIGACYAIKAPSATQMPEWIAARARDFNINITLEACQLLAQLTEGNLLAANQALEKSRLSNSPDITADSIKQLISDSAQYTVFDLSDVLLMGHVSNALHILNHLLQQGIEPTLILWSLARESRELYNLQFALSQGQSAAQVFSKIWASKKPLYQKALQRLPLDTLKQSLKACATCDRVIKGLMPGRIPDHLSIICETMTRGKSLCQHN